MCRRCRGEGIIPGPAFCTTCNGEGIRAREPGARVIKICACGSDFTRDEWLELELVGEQDDGAGGRLQLRNCPCESTIAIELADLEPGAGFLVSVAGYRYSPEQRRATGRLGGIIAAANRELNRALRSDSTLPPSAT